MKSTDYHKWQSQIRKGYLELCVLVILKRKTSSYGLEIIQLLESAEVSVNEGTLYPLLNRLNKNNWLDSYWETPTKGGHPKRYYKLSTEGASLLPNMLDSYNKTSISLTTLQAL